MQSAPLNVLLAMLATTVMISLLSSRPFVTDVARSKKEGVFFLHSRGTTVVGCKSCFARKSLPLWCM